MAEWMRARLVAGGRRTAADPVADHPAFRRHRELSHRWEEPVDAERWAGWVSTVSDHLRLSTERLAALGDALRAAIYGEMTVGFTATVLLAERVG